MDNNINIRLNDVVEKRFNLNVGEFSPQDVVSGDNVNIGFSLKLSGSIPNNSCVFNMVVNYITDDHKLLIEAVYDFVFEVENLSNYMFVVNEDQANRLRISNDIINVFLSVIVGTMRGIIVVKTAGTALSKFILPIVNIEDLKENIFGDSQEVVIE